MGKDKWKRGKDGKYVRYLIYLACSSAFPQKAQATSKQVRVSRTFRTFKTFSDLSPKSAINSPNLHLSSLFRNHFNNMAEPQSSPPPPNPDADDPPPVVPTNAEDRKAAAALSSLDAHDEDEGKPNGKGTNNIDQEALGRAISRLEMSSGVKGVGGKEDEKAKAKGKEEAGKRIKVDQADVGLLVSLFHYFPSSLGRMVLFSPRMGEHSMKHYLPTLGWTSC